MKVKKWVYKGFTVKFNPIIGQQGWTLQISKGSNIVAFKCFRLYIVAKAEAKRIIDEK